MEQTLAGEKSIANSKFHHWTCSWVSRIHFPNSQLIYPIPLFSKTILCIFVFYELKLRVQTICRLRAKRRQFSNRCANVQKLFH